MAAPSGVQPNPEAFLAAVRSACGPLSYPESPDGTLLALIDPAEILTSTGGDSGSDAAPNASVALQTLLDGGPDVSIGPRSGREPSWLVGPLQFTQSHQRVTFQPGTLIYAANNSFHGRSDCLFKIASKNWTDPAAGIVNLTVIGFGATWRMRRKDYAKTGSGKSNGWYSVSEDRAGLSIEGAVAVTLEGLTIENTGGDVSICLGVPCL